MSKLSKDKQQKLMVVAGATVVVGVGLWFGLISPLRGSLQTLRIRKHALIETLAQILANIAYSLLRFPDGSNVHDEAVTSHRVPGRRQFPCL